MTGRPLLTIVVVTYHSAGVIGDCLRSIVDDLAEAEVAPGEVALVVVDNASADDTVLVARAAAPTAEVVCSPTNDGYAAAINRGILHAPPIEAVLVLNPDLRVRPGAIAALRAAAVGHVGVAVPRVRDDHGELAASLRREPTVARAWAEAVLGGGLAARLHAGELVTEPVAYSLFHPVDWASGAALLLTVDCLRTVGPLDESFFLYSEETDYLLRARDAGYTTMFVPDAEVEHRGGEMSTSPALWSRRTTNRVRLHRRRHGRASTAAFLGASLLGEGVRAAAGRAVSRRAWLDLVRQGPGILVGPPPEVTPAVWPAWPASGSAPADRADDRDDGAVDLREAVGHGAR